MEQTGRPWNRQEITDSRPTAAATLTGSGLKTRDWETTQGVRANSSTTIQFPLEYTLVTKIVFVVMLLVTRLFGFDWPALAFGFSSHDTRLSIKTLSALDTVFDHIRTLNGISCFLRQSKLEITHKNTVRINLLIHRLSSLQSIRKETKCICTSRAH